MKYKTLGYKSSDEYLDHFLNTLLKTNKTYKYFVNWDKVRSNIKKYKQQIFLLNSLRNEPDMNIALKNLLETYPEVVKVIPLLIAARIDKDPLIIYDDEINDFFEYNFNKDKYTQEEIDKILIFLEKSGISHLLTEVKDLYDYLLGVEVGLDTNSRKNRSGEIFEKMIEKLIYEIIKNTNYTLKYQDRKTSLYKNSKGKKINRHDFVIYDGEKPLAVIEVNFYNTQGSKPDSIVGDFINLQKEAKNKGIEFIWITDGPAWKGMKNYLQKAIDEIDWVLNYNLTKKHLKYILDEIKNNLSL